MRFSHTNIISNDYRRLADFYIDTFKCVEIPPKRNLSGTWLDTGLGMEDAQLVGVHLRLPGFGEDGPTLEIYQYKETNKEPIPPPNRTGYRHIAFEVDDVDKVLAILLRNGGSTQGAISSSEIEGVGVISFIYARDPDGNLIEIQHWKRHG